MGEDRAVQLAQIGAGLDPERVDQDLACARVDLERVGLAPAAVEREHQLRMHPLTPGMLGGEPLELADQLRVQTGREVGLDARLERGQALLLQARDLRRRERLVREIVQRRAAPERQRLAQNAARRLDAAGGQLAAARGELVLEALRVELARRDPQAVARGGGLERSRGAQRVAQARDVHADRGGRALRRVLAPQPDGQPLGADRLVGRQKQHREQRARLGAGQCDQLSVVCPHAQRAENLEFHFASRTTVQGSKVER